MKRHHGYKSYRTTYPSVSEGQDVAFFILPVVLALLLNSIVCQMHEQVVLLLQVVELTRHADIAFFEVVAFVLGSDHDPEPNVKLTLADKQGLLNVLLQDEDV